MVRTKQTARPSLLRRKSPGTLQVNKIKGTSKFTQKNKQDPSAEIVAARFETFGSALTALLLLYGAALGLLLLMISDANNSVVDSLSSVIWTFAAGFSRP